ncbi:MAG: hypothetical protein JWM48_2175 [Mycobacterium sp.]|nr:hypothetical protein [Mycobacterium sp.]
MRKSTKIVGGVVIAGVVAATGSAFTASNDVPLTSTAGYGETAVTGATVSNISYALATDPSKLASVVFTATTDVTGKTAQMTLRTAGGVVGTAYPCSLGAYGTPTVGQMTITCLTADTPALASFTATGLTVSQ